MPLDLQHLTPAASINRVQIVDLPGLDVPSSIKGHTAFDLLSSQALIAQILQIKDMLHIPTSLPTRQYPQFLNLRLTSDDPTMREAAVRLATHFGSALGYVLLTLKRGDAVNRAARLDWDDSYWEHWSTIRAVHLGGGLMQHTLGKIMMQQATNIFRQAELSERQLSVRNLPLPALAPLLGMALHAPADVSAVVVIDGGGTNIKSAMARIEQGVVVALEHQRNWLSPCQDSDAVDDMELRGWLVNALVEAAVMTINTGYITYPYPIYVFISLANYVNEGQVAARGCYGLLRHLPDRPDHYLAQQISARIGQAVQVRLFHDGTAAAIVLNGQKHSAALMLGTAIGVGFAPPRGDLRAYRLELRDAR